MSRVLHALVVTALLVTPAWAGDARDEDARDCRRQVREQWNRFSAPLPAFPSNGTEMEKLRAMFRRLKQWDERERDADVMETIRRCRSTI